MASKRLACMVVIVGILFVWVIIYIPSFRESELAGYLGTKSTTQRSTSNRTNSRPHHNDISNNTSNNATVAYSTRPDLCYVHIGKAGGLSIVTSILDLLKKHSLENAIQIHLPYDRPKLDRDIDKHGTILERPLQVRVWKRNKVNSSSSLSNTITRPNEFRTYRVLGGPLAGRPKSVQACADTNHVLIWVRDPISRLISTWDFFQSRTDANVLRAARKAGVPLDDHPNRLDLNHLVETMAALGEEGLEKLYLVLKENEHALLDTSFYFGEATEAPTTWSEKSKTCNDLLDRLPVWFVGRTEYMMEDWTVFQNKTIPAGLPRSALKHTHQSQSEGKQLSNTSLSFLRRLFQSDFDCIHYMVKKSWLDQDYYDSITQEDKEYFY